MERACEIKGKEFVKFKPLYKSVRMESQAAILGNFMLNLRRLTMLFMAMFVIGQQWL